MRKMVKLRGVCTGLGSLVHEALAARNLPLETARKYTAYVGDTPELAGAGRAVACDASVTEVAPTWAAWPVDPAQC
jgi:hypothetical protein